MHVESDVIVVGAGPSGATAARTLARAGLRVAALDRARFPRHKPCGGAISVRALSRFPYLRSALERITTHWISRLHLESPSRSVVRLESETPAALMIRRVEFDALLVHLAREAGAHVYEGADVVRASEAPGRIEVEARDGRRFTARCLIACDGVHSPTARRLGLASAWPRSAVAVDMMEETPSDRLRAVDPGSLWVSYGFPAPGAGGAAPPSEGYAYVFPKRDHVNVGLGYVVSHFRESAPGSAYALQRAFVDFLRQDGVLDGESSRDCFMPYLIPIAGPLRTTARGRVLIAGDAGGFVNGFTAEGIYYAMVSGDLAAEAAARALDRPNGHAPDLSSYRAAWRAEIGAELRDSVLVQRYLLRDGARIEALVRGAAQHPALADAFVRYVMGLLPYAKARGRLLRSNPLLALRLGVEHVARTLRATIVPRAGRH